MTSYTVSSDPDPCTYTICKSNSDVCKLRIDFETFDIATPQTYDSSGTAYPTANAWQYGLLVGDCITDTLSITNPGGAVPPIICGTNTGQHMWVPASDQCNTLNFDLDTGTTTTRTWQIKVTQFECNDLMAPELDCLQWHTATTGTTASFNWDTSATTSTATITPAATTHLSNQKYDICFRRARGFCAICFSPAIHSATAQTSFGLGGSGAAAIQQATHDSLCTGVTAVTGAEPGGLAFGDWLNIQNMQNGPVTAPAAGPSKICSTYFTATTTAGTVVHNTVCTFTTPFKIGVHFDDDESHFLAVTANMLTFTENNNVYTAGSGAGWSGFYFDYWQQAC